MLAEHTERIGPFEYPRFFPSLPHQDSLGHETARHPVLIVGGGPVGLATALGLARWGIHSVIIESDDSVCAGSRAACISRRSLEILERFGSVAPFLQKGLAWHRGRSYFGNDEIFVFDMPSSTGDKHPPMINLQQYYIEQYLLDAIAQVNAQSPGCIDLRWASTVTHCTQDEHGVSARVENALGSYEIAADWLVACDGGQSRIRTLLDLTLSGTGYEGRYAIVDIELASTAPTERRAWFDPPWARGTTILMHRQPDNIWRIDFQLAQGADADAALAPAHLTRFVQTHLDAIGEGHLPWTPVWTSIYRAGAMTLASYHHGRVLFAGNAAHAMPIFGVRGLNSGLDDADNLVWKLAARIQGHGTDRLLESYSTERVQAFHCNAASAMRSTEFMSPPHRGFALMREAALSLAGRHPDIARLVNPRQTQAVTYQNSPLSWLAAAPPHGPSLGAPLIDAALEDGSHLTDHLAPQAFTLFWFGPGPAPTVPAARDTLACVATPLSASATLAALGYDTRAGSTYLVRPDGHLCAHWHAPDNTTIETALRNACGHTGVQP